MSFWARRRAAKRIRLMKEIAYLEVKGKLCEEYINGSGYLPKYIFDQAIESASKAAALRVELKFLQEQPK